MVMLYGMARVVVAMPKVLRGLTSTYRGVRSSLSTTQAGTKFDVWKATEFERRIGDVDNALNSAEREATAAKAAQQAGPEAAVTEPGTAKPSGESGGEAPAPAPEPSVPSCGETPASTPAPTPHAPEPSVLPEAAVVEEPPPSSSAAAGDAADPRVIKARSALEQAVKEAGTAAEERRLAHERAATAQKKSEEATAAYEQAIAAKGAPRAQARAAQFAARDEAERAQKAIASADRRVTRAAEAHKRADANLKRVEEAVAAGAVLRLDSGEHFSPGKRRPEFKGKGPALPSARGAPVPCRRARWCKLSKTRSSPPPTRNVSPRSSC
jgi:hypothetical protein